MKVNTELRFEHCPHCGGNVKRIRSHRKKCEKCGTVYFFRNSPVEDGKLKVEEIDRSEYKKEAEKRLVAARLRGDLGEDRQRDHQNHRLKAI
ncbi:hypothetical protein AKJ40_00805 [candidate division MSBL1 archaeon SCGC-AAA259M10]|uniref:Uncharacterized protein n=2 Tax=candidate division MSBL1 TaxID=215777 RepID=A0A133U894_9EURY|nr:hypothetical protein AKJ61_00890 [candidate division MSBL1 archaeon SCGC-AAA259B11]KXB00732.1 hypothetical protein AKJ40_00805 [candidate division MSBL1 archaeon SCGC-AAA259M10]